MAIFLDDADYRQFVHVLGDIAERFNIQCWNYCVMPNHYHATLQPARANLSEALRCLHGHYAQWWNRRHQRVGHVFQGRFKDQIVERDSYLFALSRYVVMNPVRAGLVKRPEDWPWSSYRATAGLSPPPSFLSTALTLQLFGDGGHHELQPMFVAFVTKSPEDPELCDRIRSNDRVLGTHVFKGFVGSSGHTPV
jgi:REP element-mobilizing transposase RayT